MSDSLPGGRLPSTKRNTGNINVGRKSNEARTQVAQAAVACLLLTLYPGPFSRNARHPESTSAGEGSLFRIRVLPYQTRKQRTTNYPCGLIFSVPLGHFGLNSESPIFAFLTILLYRITK